MLLVTDGRTTDLLETLLGEKMHVTVMRQEQWNEGEGEAEEGSPYYLRESVLSGAGSGFVVSHNIALVHSKNVPQALFEKIAHKEEGIGKAISSIGVESFRKVIESGRLRGEEAVDLFGKPVTLRFPALSKPVPYKKYVIYFGLVPGIQLLEYYNPELIPYRLKRLEQADGV
nr:4-hydroxybenzoate synthetase [Paenibacillus soyae]